MPKLNSKFALAGLLCGIVLLCLAGITVGLAAGGGSLIANLLSVVVFAAWIGIAVFVVYVVRQRQLVSALAGLVAGILVAVLLSMAGILPK